MLSVTSRQPVNLLEEPVGSTLTRLTIPVIFGFLAIHSFNLVDTFFVGLIGASELAAISFTFPISFAIMTVALGIGIGTSSTLSKQIGAGQGDDAKKTAAAALVLVTLVILSVSAISITTLHPVFRLLGASSETISLIRNYMAIWLAGVIFLGIPMVGNSIIRATGDTKTPAYIMGMAGLANGILDPLLIFGIGPFPELGMQGAAIATVISWIFASAAVLWFLGVNGYMGIYKNLKMSALTNGFKKITYVAIPATITNATTPLGAAILTAIIAAYGEAAVAGFGVGTRIEPIALVVVLALSSSCIPFVGQNFGANKLDRIKRSAKLALTFCICWEAMIAGILYLSSGFISRTFSNNDEVMYALTAYLALVPLSYGCQGMIIVVCSALNALHRPVQATYISSIRLFLLVIPCASLGGVLMGIPGIFGGIALGNIIGATIATTWFFALLRRVQEGGGA